MGTSKTLLHLFRIAPRSGKISNTCTSRLVDEDTKFTGSELNPRTEVESFVKRSEDLSADAGSDEVILKRKTVRVGISTAANISSEYFLFHCWIVLISPLLACVFIVKYYCAMAK